MVAVSSRNREVYFVDKKVAEQGNAEAQYHLAQIFENARGVDQSDVEAARWSRKKAAYQGLASAQYDRLVGFFNEKDLGAMQSDVEAAQWKRKAADQDYPYV